MNRINKAMLGVAIALLPTTNAWAGNVTMHTPANFQVMSVSPNGKWACGVFIDGAMNTYGFRWNLLGGSIEMLGTETSTAWDVADDGTVSGDFNDKQVLENGAGIPMPGFWKDGKWHHIEMPKGTVSDGMGTGISPDGHYMTGSICVDGIYTPYIWQDGKILKSLNTGNDAVAYAVSPDGQSAAGFSTQNNRTACIWNSDDKIIYFEDSEFSQSPWNYSRNFSPDGSKLLYWGGWSVENEEDVYLYSIYDLNTGTRTKVKAPSYDSDLEFFDISNNGLLVGYDHERGYIYTEGESMYIDDYLKRREVDLSSFDDFYGGTDYYVGQLPINKVVAVSEDENVYAMLYYNSDGLPASMILKIDQNLSDLSPAEFKASQLNGINAVALTWKRPVGANSIRGYNVYRDGKKLNGMLPVNVPYFYDSDLEPGTYSYQVSALNVDGTEKYGETLSVEVKTGIIQHPLSLFARQKGIKNIHTEWELPLSNMAHKHYYDLDTDNLNSLSIYMPVDVEMGIRFDKNEMAQYAGHQLCEVSFYPMSVQDRWTVNVYTYDNDGKLTPVASQPIDQDLKYGQLNTVKFDKPVDLPSGDLIVAIEVSVAKEANSVIGAQNGRVTPEYSDLIRMKTEDDFYSTYDSSLQSGLSITCLSWAIDLGLKKADDSKSDVTHYNVYLDSDLIGTTDATQYLIENAADGEHVIGIEAVYSDGSISESVNTFINLKAAYINVDDVTIDTGDEGSTEIKATWERPVDTDITNITYTTAKKHANGIKGVSDNGYAIMAAAEYPSAMTRGYDGYKIKSFNFYPLADALFTFMLYENEDLIYELEVDNFTIGTWNYITLPDDVEIDGHSKYRLVLDCFDPEPDVLLLAIDNQMPRPYISDLYSITYGEEWNSLSIETGAMGSWMLGMYIEDPETSDLDIIGYDVLIDNKVINEAKVTDTEFVYDFGKSDNRMHTIRINTYYESLDSYVEGETCFFRLSTTGIADAMIANIKLTRESNYLVAKGATSMTVYTSSGMEIAKASDDKININSLEPGIYVVQIVTPQGVATHKINLQR